MEKEEIGRLIASGVLESEGKSQEKTDLRDRIFKFLLREFNLDLPKTLPGKSLKKKWEEAMVNFTVETPAAVPAEPARVGTPAPETKKEWPLPEMAKDLISEIAECFESNKSGDLPLFGLDEKKLNDYRQNLLGTFFEEGDLNQPKDAADLELMGKHPAELLAEVKAFIDKKREQLGMTAAEIKEFETNVAAAKDWDQEISNKIRQLFELAPDKRKELVGQIEKYEAAVARFYNGYVTKAEIAEFNNLFNDLVDKLDEEIEKAETAKTAAPAAESAAREAAVEALLAESGSKPAAVASVSAVETAPAAGEPAAEKDLAEIINNPKGMSPEEMKQMAPKLQKYFDNYFSPLPHLKIEWNAAGQGKIKEIASQAQDYWFKLKDLSKDSRPGRQAAGRIREIYKFIVDSVELLAGSQREFEVKVKAAQELAKAAEIKKEPSLPQAVETKKAEPFFEKGQYVYINQAARNNQPPFGFLMISGFGQKGNQKVVYLRSYDDNGQPTDFIKSWMPLNEFKKIAELTDKVVLKKQGIVRRENKIWSEKPKLRLGVGTVETDQPTADKQAIINGLKIEKVKNMEAELRATLVRLSKDSELASKILGLLTPPIAIDLKKPANQITVEDLRVMALWLGDAAEMLKEAADMAIPPAPRVGEVKIEPAAGALPGLKKVVKAKVEPLEEVESAADKIAPERQKELKSEAEKYIIELNKLAADLRQTEEAREQAKEFSDKLSELISDVDFSEDDEFSSKVDWPGHELVIQQAKDLLAKQNKPTADDSAEAEESPRQMKPAGFGMETYAQFDSGREEPSAKAETKEDWEQKAAKLPFKVGNFLLVHQGNKDDGTWQEEIWHIDRIDETTIGYSVARIDHGSIYSTELSHRPEYEPLGNYSEGVKNWDETLDLYNQLFKDGKMVKATEAILDYLLKQPLTPAEKAAVLEEQKLLAAESAGEKTATGSLVAKAQAIRADIESMLDEVEAKPAKNKTEPVMVSEPTTGEQMRKLAELKERDRKINDKILRVEGMRSRLWSVYNEWSNDMGLDPKTMQPKVLTSAEQQAEQKKEAHMKRIREFLNLGSPLYDKKRGRMKTVAEVTDGADGGKQELADASQWLEDAERVLNNSEVLNQKEVDDQLAAVAGESAVDREAEFFDQRRKNITQAVESGRLTKEEGDDFLAGLVEAEVAEKEPAAKVKEDWERKAEQLPFKAGDFLWETGNIIKEIKSIESDSINFRLYQLKSSGWEYYDSSDDSEWDGELGKIDYYSQHFKDGSIRLATPAEVAKIASAKPGKEEEWDLDTNLTEEEFEDLMADRGEEILGLAEKLVSQIEDYLKLNSGELEGGEQRLELQKGVDELKKQYQGKKSLNIGEYKLYDEIEKLRDLFEKIKAVPLGSELAVPGEAAKGEMELSRGEELKQQVSDLFEGLTTIEEEAGQDPTVKEQATLLINRLSPFVFTKENEQKNPAEVNSQKAALRELANTAEDFLADPLKWIKRQKEWEKNAEARAALEAWVKPGQVFVADDCTWKNEKGELVKGKIFSRFLGFNGKVDPKFGPEMDLENLNEDGSNRRRVVDHANLTVKDFQSGRVRLATPEEMAAIDKMAEPIAEKVNLTAEAEELLAKVAAGGVPAYRTKNLERIMAENGIEMGEKDTPNSLIEKLRAKKDGLVLAAPAAEEKEIVPDREEIARIIKDAKDKIYEAKKLLHSEWYDMPEGPERDEKGKQLEPYFDLLKDVPSPDEWEEVKVWLAAVEALGIEVWAPQKQSGMASALKSLEEGTGLVDLPGINFAAIFEEADFGKLQNYCREAGDSKEAEAVLIDKISQVLAAEGIEAGDLDLPGLAKEVLGNLNLGIDGEAKYYRSGFWDKVKKLPQITLQTGWAFTKNIGIYAGVGIGFAQLPMFQSMTDYRALALGVATGATAASIRAALFGAGKLKAMLSGGSTGAEKREMAKKQKIRNKVVDKLDTETVGAVITSQLRQVTSRSFQEKMKQMMESEAGLAAMPTLEQLEKFAGAVDDASLPLLMQTLAYFKDQYGDRLSSEKQEEMALFATLNLRQGQIDDGKIKQAVEAAKKIDPSWGENLFQLIDKAVGGLKEFMALRSGAATGRGPVNPSKKSSEAWKMTGYVGAAGVIGGVTGAVIAEGGLAGRMGLGAVAGGGLGAIVGESLATTAEEKVLKDVNSLLNDLEAAKAGSAVQEFYLEHLKSKMQLGLFDEKPLLKARAENILRKLEKKRIKEKLSDGGLGTVLSDLKSETETLADYQKQNLKYLERKYKGARRSKALFQLGGLTAGVIAGGLFGKEWFERVTQTGLMGRLWQKGAEAFNGQKGGAHGSEPTPAAAKASVGVFEQLTPKAPSAETPAPSAQEPGAEEIKPIDLRAIFPPIKTGLPDNNLAAGNNIESPAATPAPAPGSEAPTAPAEAPAVVLPQEIPSAPSSDVSAAHNVTPLAEEALAKAAAVHKAQGFEHAFSRELTQMAKGDAELASFLKEHGGVGHWAHKLAMENEVLGQKIVSGKDNLGIRWQGDKTPIEARLTGLRIENGELKAGVDLRVGGQPVTPEAAGKTVYHFDYEQKAPVAAPAAFEVPKGSLAGKAIIDGNGKTLANWESAKFSPDGNLKSDSVSVDTADLLPIDSVKDLAPLDKTTLASVLDKNSPAAKYLESTESANVRFVASHQNFAPENADPDSSEESVFGVVGNRVIAHIDANSKNLDPKAVEEVVEGTQNLVTAADKIAGNLNVKQGTAVELMANVHGAKGGGSSTFWAGSKINPEAVAKETADFVKASGVKPESLNTPARCEMSQILQTGGAVPGKVGLALKLTENLGYGPETNIPLAKIIAGVGEQKDILPELLNAKARGLDVSGAKATVTAGVVTIENIKPATGQAFGIKILADINKQTAIGSGQAIEADNIDKVISQALNMKAK